MATNGVRIDKKRKASSSVKGKPMDKVKKARTETPKAPKEAKPVKAQEPDESDDFDGLSSDSDDGGVKLDSEPAKAKKSFDGKSFEKGQ